MATNGNNTTTTYFVENGSKKENMKFVKCAGCEENIPQIENKCECGGNFAHACQSKVIISAKGKQIEIKKSPTVQKEDGTMIYYLECQKCSSLRYKKVKILK